MMSHHLPNHITHNKNKMAQKENLNHLFLNIWKIFKTESPLIYFTELITASKALGLFIAKSARTLRLRPTLFLAILPMNCE